MKIIKLLFFLLYPIVSFCDSHACFIYNHTPLDTNLNELQPYFDTYSRVDNLKNRYNDLEVDISLDKTSYLKGENIVLFMKLKNVSGKVVPVDLTDNYININFIIKNLKGQYARYYGDISEYFGTNIYNMKPGEEKEYKLLLLDMYGTTRLTPPTIPFRFDGFLDAENYTIAFKKPIGKEEVLESNTINFTIEEPKDEESSAFNSLLRIYSIKTHGYYIDKINAYREFIYSYPNSVYVDQAFMFMMQLKTGNGIPKDPTILDDCNWFLNRKPNSQLIKYAFYSAIAEMGVMGYSKDETIKYVNDIIKNYPDTEASRLAADYLNKNK